MISLIISTLLNEQQRMREAIAAVKPELLGEFDSLGTVPISSVGGWLDEHFPLPKGSWATLPIDGTGERIKHLFRVDK